MYLPLPAQYTEQGLCNGPSVCLLILSIDNNSGGFAAERGRLHTVGYRPTAGTRRRSTHTAANTGRPIVMLRAEGRGSTQNHYKLQHEWGYSSDTDGILMPFGGVQSLSRFFFFASMRACLRIRTGSE